VKNVTGGGVRWLDVPAERFTGWISDFDRRHGNPEHHGDSGHHRDPGHHGDPGQQAGSGELEIAPADGAVAFAAPDGAVAVCHPPFAESFALPPAPAGPDEVAAAIAAHARAPRAVGVLLVRLGGYAAGVFVGYPPALADAKVGSRLVHGRSAAGGWSQQRFARRREKQANEALDAAATVAVTVFSRWASGITATSAPAPGQAAGVPGRKGASRSRSGGDKTATGADATAAREQRLDAVVLGGDKRAVAGLRDDPRLAPFLAIATERFLTVPDPKRAVLESTPKLFTAVRIRLTEPGPGGPGGRPPG
jgi:hypothetical protein